MKNKQPYKQKSTPRGKTPAPPVRSAGKSATKGMEPIRTKKKIGKVRRAIDWIKIQNVLTLVIFIGTVLYLTVGRNTQLMLKLQDLDLFVSTVAFFSERMQEVGGFSVYLGSFLTQFFCHPVLGSLIYLLFLLLVSMLTAKAFGLKGGKLPLAFIPALALLLSVTELGYLIYVLKVSGYPFVGVLGMIFALGGLILFKKFGNGLSASLFALGYLLVVYPLAGFYAVLGAVLMLVYSLRQALLSKDWKLGIPALVMLVGLGTIPKLYYWLVYDTICSSSLFFANLPNIRTTEAERILWLPYVLIVLFVLIAVLWREKSTVAGKKSSLLLRLVPPVLFLAVLAASIGCSYRDKNFETELAMQSASEREDWDQVLKLARNQSDEPTRQIVMNTNLALYKLGLASDKMFHYPNGNKPVNSPRELLQVEYAGPFFYYQYGKQNYCYRWCMEDMVEFGASVSNLKYFVLCCIANGETELAGKYNEQLKGTLFHRSWAKRYQTFIDDPKKITEDPEFMKIRELNTYENSLDGDHGQLEPFLRKSFAYMNGGSPAFQELSILFALDIKKIDLFWPKFFTWVMTQKRLPVHFQEAALLYNHLEKKYDLSPVPFDPKIVDNFHRFQDYVEKYAGYPEETVRPMYKDQFGDTFWFYYFFVKEHSDKQDVADKHPYSS
jgi:hypothetical protein